MSLRPVLRSEVCRKNYKVVVDADEARRKREDNIVEIRKNKREESLLKKRREGMQVQQFAPAVQSSAVEKKQGRLCQFKGQGRVLGSSSLDGTDQNSVQRHWQSSTPSLDNRPKNPPQNNRAVAINETLEQRISEPDSHLKSKQVTASNSKPQGFDPFESHISSRVAPKSGSSLDMCQCLVCDDWFKSEQEVSDERS